MSDLENINMSDDEFDITQEANDKVLLALMSEKGSLMMKTDLSDSEITYISHLLYLANAMRLDSWKQYATILMQLKISRHRKGREEIIESLKNYKMSQGSGFINQ